MGNSSNKGAIEAKQKAVIEAKQAVDEHRAATGKKGIGPAEAVVSDADSGDESLDEYGDNDSESISLGGNSPLSGSRTESSARATSRLSKNAGASNGIDEDPKADEEVEDAYDVNDFSKAMTD